MVAHPRVLTQRTPVLRSGDILSLLCALLSAALFRGGFLLGAAFLCSCHIVLLLSLDFTPRTQDTVALLLLYTSVNVIQHIVVYICFLQSCQRFFLRINKSERRRTL